jgi:hypothetical protein
LGPRVATGSPPTAGHRWVGFARSA